MKSKMEQEKELRSLQQLGVVAIQKGALGHHHPQLRSPALLVFV